MYAIVEHFAQLVATLPDPVVLAGSVGARKPSTLGEMPAIDVSLAEEVWAKCPHVKVLMITQEGRGAVLHTLQPHPIVLGGVSSQSVVAVIRGTPTW